MKTKKFLLSVALIATQFARAEDCALANDLVYRANELHNQQAPLNEQIAVLTQAVAECPSNIYAHNNLANLLGDVPRFEEAVQHYRAALNIKPDFINAWYGLGETYQQWGKLPQSLEALLHICHDSEARKQITALLKDNRFVGAETGEVLDREALLLLFDKERRIWIGQQVKKCEIGAGRAVMDALPVLRNLEFATGKATLSENAVNRRQVEEIAAALEQLGTERRIQLHGHSDDQLFANVSRAESDQRNLRLSQERAESIRAALVAQGVAAQRIQVTGHGNRNPISGQGDRNRRVEIAVE